jgi:ADP-ribose pyrophosphatase
VTPQPADEYHVTARKAVFAGRILSVRVDTVQMSDGKLADREVVVHPGAVAIVALDDDDRAVMVSQYRHPVTCRLLELPAGLLDIPGEPALAAAQRELAEEAALTAQRWWTLVDIFPSPGMSTEAIRIFLAQGLREIGEHLRFKPEDEELTLTVQRVPLTELVSAALGGQLRNGAAVSGILAADRAVARGLDTLRSATAPWPDRPGH